MSDTRTPCLILTKYLPVIDGKHGAKKCKLELFPARHFRNKFEPGKDIFYPKVPLKTDARERYWKAHYRLRINGLWYSKTKQYQFFTLAGVYRYFADL